MNTTNRIPIGAPPRLPPRCPVGDPDAPQGSALRRTSRALVALAAVATLALPSGPLAAEEGATLAALEIAYGRELNAQSHYVAFAAEARREDRCAVACLFRAVARAESVHAARHAAAIVELNGRLSWRHESVVVQETAKNLATSIALERWERDRVYPRFAEYARAECLYEALAAINYARGAEATHAALFAEALAGLEHEPMPRRIAVAALRPVALDPPAGCGTQYYLCLGDGSAFSSPVRGSCPNCGSRGARIVTLACPGGSRRAPPGGSAGPLVSR